jgi:hypothetical protein
MKKIKIKSKPTMNQIHNMLLTEKSKLMISKNENIHLKRMRKATMKEL